MSAPELHLRDVLCICPLLVAAGAQDDDWIQKACHTHTVEVLTRLERSGSPDDATRLYLDRVERSTTNPAVLAVIAEERAALDEESA